jgi:Sec-independent protein secretion pathway component TatC
MLLEMAPLVVLYELSIVLAKAFGTPAEKLDAAAQGS